MKQDIYKGFELGPIRPPSESRSLLLRFTRNCPWNHCTFCPVYKNKVFSLRSKENIKKDIDLIYKFINIFREKEILNSNSSNLKKIRENIKFDEISAFQSALSWFYSGMKSIFIQDANSLIMKPQDLIDLLLYIKKLFPYVKRITSYARSQTAANIKTYYLKEMKEAGLNRIHIGMESGSNNVLNMVKKGATKEIHIKAGLKIKEAGIEISEYFMPGLGGKTFSTNHAIESADVLNQVKPDFIRLRTLALPSNTILFNEYINKKFKKLSEVETVEEIKLFVENLQNIESYLRCDHILNLFQDMDGKISKKKDNMLKMLNDFLNLKKEDKLFYIVGRRLSKFYCLKDMENTEDLNLIKSFCESNNIKYENVDEFVFEMMSKFIQKIELR